MKPNAFVFLRRSGMHDGNAELRASFTLYDEVRDVPFRGPSAVESCTLLWSIRSAVCAHLRLGVGDTPAAVRLRSWMNLLLAVHDNCGATGQNVAPSSWYPQRFASTNVLQTKKSVRRTPCRNRVQSQTKVFHSLAVHW